MRNFEEQLFTEHLQWPLLFNVSLKEEDFPFNKNFFFVLALCLACKCKEIWISEIPDMCHQTTLDRRALSQMRLSSTSQVCVARELNTLDEQQNVKKNFK